MFFRIRAAASVIAAAAAIGGAHAALASPPVGGLGESTPSQATPDTPAPPERGVARSADAAAADSSFVAPPHNDFAARRSLFDARPPPTGRTPELAQFHPRGQ